MSYRFSATLSPNGLVAVPADVLERLGVKAGDRLEVELSSPHEAGAGDIGKVSILESRNDLPRISLGRPLTQQDIDDAIGEEMIEQETRIRKQYQK